MATATVTTIASFVKSVRKATWRLTQPFASRVSAIIGVVTAVNGCGNFSAALVNWRPPATLVVKSVGE